MKTKHLLKRMHLKSKQSISKFHVVAVAVSKSNNVLDISMSKPVRNRHDPIGHAEWQLMTKYGRGVDTIYIGRFNRRGTNSCSISPCKMCSNLASRLQIKIVSLTNDGE